MKRLLLDLGNTRLKWRRFDGAALLDEGALAHADAHFDEGLDALAASASDCAAWLASVAPDALTSKVVRQLAVHLPLAPQRVRVQQDMAGLRLVYADPQQLGVDRWLAMLGARRVHAGPCVVALAGTALTLDAVDAEGLHLGGLIVPGLGLQRRVLTEGPLFLRGSDAAPVLFADSTAHAVASGPAQALAALIKRFATAVTERCGAAPTVWLSGGDGGRLATLLTMPAKTHPELVLEGLASILTLQCPT
ncbi:MAG TPA: type III pantothenate kinase [Xanthomonadaceae bacterium]|nr:type III pantothenate kinase [Xanthomonadaceae bacterium]